MSIVGGDDMKEPNKSEGLPFAFDVSLLLFCVTLGIWFFEGNRLSNAGTGGDGGFVVLGEYIRLRMICFGGLFMSWLLALAAAQKSRYGVWLAILETPFLLFAIGLCVV